MVPASAMTGLPGPPVPRCTVLPCLTAVARVLDPPASMATTTSPVRSILAAKPLTSASSDSPTLNGCGARPCAGSLPRCRRHLATPKVTYMDDHVLAKRVANALIKDAGMSSAPLPHKAAIGDVVQRYKQAYGGIWVGGTVTLTTSALQF